MSAALEKIIAVVDRQETLENEAATLEEQFKAKRAELRAVSENELGELKEQLIEVASQGALTVSLLSAKIAQMRLDLEQADEDEAKAEWVERIKKEQAALAEATQALVVYDEAKETFLFPDGRILKFDQKIHLGIPVEDLEKRALCFGHLREVGAENICMARVTVDFPKGMTVEAQRFAAQVQRLFPELDITIDGIADSSELKDAVKKMLEQFPQAKVYSEWAVNAATLKAWAKKRLRDGFTIPAEFGLYAPLKVSVVRAKG